MKKICKNIGGFQGWLFRLIRADKKLDNMNHKLTKKIERTDAPVIRYNGQKINAKWEREDDHFDVHNYCKKLTDLLLILLERKICVT
jgi:uncharacterized protein